MENKFAQFFYLAMTETTPRVTGRRASLNEFPNRVWELEKRFPALMGYWL
jgi:hypothetical protein